VVSDGLPDGNEIADLPSVSGEASEDDTAPAASGRLRSFPARRAPATGRLGQPARPSVGQREIVNGLDRRELRYGFTATVLAGGLSVLGYATEHASTVSTTRQEAGTLLVSMLIGTVLLGLGTAFRRRALLGFAAFMVGLEQLSVHFLPGTLAYMGFGAWLIYRVLQKNKQGRGTGAPVARAVATPVKTSAAPTASKRYTPPKRTSSAKRR
jgi:hypothetical protein